MFTQGPPCHLYYFRPCECISRDSWGSKSSSPLLTTRFSTFPEAAKEADAFRQKLLSNEGTLQKLQNDFKKSNTENKELVKEVSLFSFAQLVELIRLHDSENPVYKSRSGARYMKLGRGWSADVVSTLSVEVT